MSDPNTHTPFTAKAGAGTWMSRPAGAHTIGSWLAIVSVALQVAAFGIQLYSILDWDAAVDAGLQIETLSGEGVGDVESTLARHQWGNSVGDVVWWLPISIVALMGLTAGKAYSFAGFVAALAVLSFGVYWPLTVVLQRGPEHLPVVLASVLVFGFPSALGLWGLLANGNQYLEATSTKIE